MSLEEVIALRCLSLVEDHNPLSLQFTFSTLSTTEEGLVHCSVCNVDIPQMQVIAHLKGTGSPWWVTAHRQRRHETRLDYITPDTPDGGQCPPDETHLQGFWRYVANWSAPKHVVILEDLTESGTNSPVESRRIYCEICRAVIMNHRLTQEELISGHLNGAAHRHCEAHMAPSIDWLGDLHGHSNSTTSDTQKKILAKVQRNLKSRVKAKEALQLDPRILFGAPIDGVVLWLQARFQPGMSWMNYGSWHIDHVMPVAVFDTTDPLQCLVMCHYTNLQPLWGHQNLAKGAKAGKWMCEP